MLLFQCHFWLTLFFGVRFHASYGALLDKFTRGSGGCFVEIQKGDQKVSMPVEELVLPFIGFFLFIPPLYCVIQSPLWSRLFWDAKGCGFCILCRGAWLPVGMLLPSKPPPPVFMPSIARAETFNSSKVSLVKHALAIFDLTLVDCWANL